MTYEKIDVDLFNQEQAIELEQDELECLSQAEQEDISFSNSVLVNQAFSK